MHAGLALWVTDRLYEANAEDIISGIGDSAMAVSDAGKWTALAVLIGVRLGWGARGLLIPLQVQVEAVEDDKPNMEPPTVKSARRKRRAMEKMVNRIQKVRLLLFTSSAWHLRCFVCRAPCIVQHAARAFHLLTTEALSWQWVAVKFHCNSKCC